MNNERDMFYSGYGYGMGPIPGMMPNNMEMVGGNTTGMNIPSNTNIPNQSNYMLTWNQDINNRIDKLERRINRLDQRITRLETPYQNTTYNNEPDNNMYMM